MPTTATAWVTIGPLVEPERRVTAGGPYLLAVTLLLTIGFSVAGNEANAEDNIADAISAISRRIAQNRINTVGGVAPLLGGTVKNVELPRPAAGPADYLVMAGSEVRAYPLGIDITQYETVS
jgi:hypothetical protein